MKARWAIVAVGFVFAACGTAADDERFNQTTPGAKTGAPVAATPAPAAPGATPAPSSLKPVSKAEEAVIRGWADELRHGRVAAASRYFAVPSVVSNAAPTEVLRSRAAVREFNRGLPCGAKLIRTRRSADGFVVGIFRLTERPGAGECGTGTDQLAAVAFLIENKHIASWVRVPDDTSVPGPAAAEPTATATPSPTPSATATASPSPSPTPSGTPTPSPTPVPTDESGAVSET